MSVHVCVCMCVYVCMYVCMCECVCVCIRVYIKCCGLMVPSRAGIGRCGPLSQSSFNGFPIVVDTLRGGVHQHDHRVEVSSEFHIEADVFSDTAADDGGSVQAWQRNHRPAAVHTAKCEWLGKFRGHFGE